MAAVQQFDDVDREDLKRRVTRFLDSDDNPDSEYIERIQNAMEGGSERLVMNVNEVCIRGRRSAGDQAGPEGWGAGRRVGERGGGATFRKSRRPDACFIRTPGVSHVCLVQGAAPIQCSVPHTNGHARAHAHAHPSKLRPHSPSKTNLTRSPHLPFPLRAPLRTAPPSSIAFNPPHLHLRTHTPVPRKLRDFDAPLAGELLQNPLSTIPAFNEALGEFIAAKPDFVSKTKELPTMQLGFEGNFGSQHVSPRQLLAFLLGRMVCVEGIVTKCSLVRPKVVKSTHFCPATKKFSQREYRDATSFEGAPTQSVYPTKDENNNPLETEFGLR